MNAKAMWLIGVLLTLAGGAFGFGISQWTSAAEVSRRLVVTETKVETLTIKEETDRVEGLKRDEDSRTDFTQRMMKLTDLLEAFNTTTRESITQNSRLVDTLNVQIKLIQEQNAMLNNRRP